MGKQVREDQIEQLKMARSAIDGKTGESELWEAKEELEKQKKLKLTIIKTHADDLMKVLHKLTEDHAKKLEELVTKLKAAHAEEMSAIKRKHQYAML